MYGRWDRYSVSTRDHCSLGAQSEISCPAMPGGRFWQHGFGSCFGWNIGRFYASYFFTISDTCTAPPGSTVWADPGTVTTTLPLPSEFPVDAIIRTASDSIPATGVVYVATFDALKSELESGSAEHMVITQNIAWSSSGGIHQISVLNRNITIHGRCGASGLERCVLTASSDASILIKRHLHIRNTLPHTQGACDGCRTICDSMVSLSFVTISNVEFQGGSDLHYSAHGSAWQAHGGSIAIFGNVILRLFGVIFRGNQAKTGAAIHTDGQDGLPRLIARDTEFINNVGGRGGAVFLNAAKALFINCTFSGNTADKASYAPNVFAAGGESNATFLDSHFPGYEGTNMGLSECCGGYSVYESS